MIPVWLPRKPEPGRQAQKGLACHPEKHSETRGGILHIAKLWVAYLHPYPSDSDHGNGHGQEDEGSTLCDAIGTALHPGGQVVVQDALVHPLTRRIRMCTS